MGASKKEYELIHQQDYLENMKSTVEAVQANGTFDNDYGTMYKFEYTMKDGATLSANHKKPESMFMVGTEVEYEIKGQSKYGAYGSVKKPDSGNFPTASAGGGFKAGSDTSIHIARQSSLKVALEYFHLVGWPEGKEGDIKLLCNTAEYFTKYVVSPFGDAPKQSATNGANVAKTAPEVSQSAIEQQDLDRETGSAHLGDPDDLPF